MIVLVLSILAVAAFLLVSWLIASRGGSQRADEFFEDFRETHPYRPSAGRPGQQPINQAQTATVMGGDFRQAIDELSTAVHSLQDALHEQSDTTDPALPVLRPQVHGLLVDMDGRLPETLAAAIDITLAENQHDYVIVYGVEELPEQLSQVYGLGTLANRLTGAISEENRGRVRLYSRDQVEHWIETSDVRTHTEFSVELYQQMGIESLWEQYACVHLVSLLPTCRLRSRWDELAYSGQLPFEKSLNLGQSTPPKLRVERLSVLCGYSWKDIEAVGQFLKDSQSLVDVLQAILDSHNPDFTVVFPEQADPLHDEEAREFLLDRAHRGSSTIVPSQYKLARQPPEHSESDR